MNAADGIPGSRWVHVDKCLSTKPAGENGTTLHNLQNSKIIVEIHAKYRPISKNSHIFTPSSPRYRWFGYHFAIEKGAFLARIVERNEH